MHGIYSIGFSNQGSVSVVLFHFKGEGSLN